MSLLDWKYEYSVGVKSIDEQHKKILELINELIESIRDSREDYIINDVLNDLLEYANYHFSLEEKLLHKFSYSNEHDHETKHREFTDKIKSLKIEENVHVGNIPIETLDYLENWFCNHELRDDSMYYEYFKSKGLINEIEKIIEESKL